MLCRLLHIFFANRRRFFTPFGLPAGILLIPESKSPTISIAGIICGINGLIFKNNFFEFFVEIEIKREKGWAHIFSGFSLGLSRACLEATVG